MRLISRALSKKGNGLDGNLHLKLKDYSLHERVNAIKQDKNNIEAWAELAQALKTRGGMSSQGRIEGWYKSAMEVYKAALKFNPGNEKLEREKRALKEFAEYFHYKIE
jgi:hypothetical protein